MPFGISFGSSSKPKDHGSDGSISPPPMSKKELRKQKGNGGMSYIHDYTSKDEPSSRYRLRNVVDPRSNGHFMDMQAFGSGGHHGGSHSSARSVPRSAQPNFVQSKLVQQMESSLTQSIHQALLHWDEHALTLESNYDELLHERNGLHQENRSLQKQVAALQKDVNEKVALLKEFQEGHMKSAGSRRLAPSTSAISDDYEALERLVKNTVFARLARLNIRHADIKKLLKHEPFMEAVKESMVDQTAAKDAENLPLGLSEVVPAEEVKGLLNWMTQSVIHSVLHRRVMEMGMPGLHEDELKTMNKVFELIMLSEGGQGVKNAEQWRADTYKRLAYWAENVDDLTKYAESSMVVAEVASLFSTIIDGAEQDLFRILEPLCDESTAEGTSFRNQLVAIVDTALQFSILIGSQVSRYKLLKTMQPQNGTDFVGVPEHFEDSSADTTPLFYAVPALVKMSNEEGETYESAELLVPGKIYLLFNVTPPRNLDEEDEPAASVPDTTAASTSTPEQKAPREIKLASPVNGEDMVEESTDSSLDIISREDASPTSYKSAIEKTQPAQEQQRAQERTDHPTGLQRRESDEPSCDDAERDGESDLAADGGAAGRGQRRHRYDDLRRQRERHAAAAAGGDTKQSGGDTKSGEAASGDHPEGRRNVPARSSIHDDDDNGNVDPPRDAKDSPSTSAGGKREPRQPTSMYNSSGSTDNQRQQQKTLGTLQQQQSPPVARKQIPSTRTLPDRSSSLAQQSSAPASATAAAAARSAGGAAGAGGQQPRQQPHPNPSHGIRTSSRPISTSSSTTAVTTTTTTTTATNGTSGTAGINITYTVGSGSGSGGKGTAVSPSAIRGPGPGGSSSSATRSFATVNVSDRDSFIERARNRTSAYQQQQQQQQLDFNNGINAAQRAKANGQSGGYGHNNGGAGGGSGGGSGSGEGRREGYGGYGAGSRGR
ncbi:hypothetical protein TWF696_002622 [Orbilia brochopaga]|uniref:Uncharacterized protein n=1 Tax=Orbilia brochopaga TaxID=3140254 RepID=A0AAV9U3C5_9PEZI